MRLRELQLLQHPILQDLRVTFNDGQPIRPMFADLFGRLNINIFAGPNGTGKTSILSLLAQAFHFIEYGQDSIVSDFILKYDIKHDDIEDCRVILERGGGDMYIASPSLGLAKSRIVDRTRVSARTRKSDQQNTIELDQVLDLMPSHVVVSAFSMHGEYPINRPGNFKWTELVTNYDIGDVYGKNHYDLPTLSRGIGRLLQQKRDNPDSMLYMEKVLQAEITNTVFISSIHLTKHELLQRGVISESAWVGPEDIWHESSIFSEHFRQWDDSRQTRYRAWVHLNEATLDAAYKGEIYLNDLVLVRRSNPTSLATMSSGEKMLLVRILSVLSSIDDGSLVIIEEPEMHLDPAWTKQLMTIFASLFRTYSAHVLVATHSFSFINSMFPENIIVLRNNRAENPSFQTFMANESEISSQLYDQQPNFAENYLEKAISRSKPEELALIFKQLGESSYRFELFHYLRSLASK